MGYKAQGNLSDFGQTEPMRDAQRRTVSRVGDLLKDRVTEHTPVAQPPPGAAAEWLAARKRLPGTLKHSWRVGSLEMTAGAETMSIDVYTMDQIAPYVEYPTRPHIIAPRNPLGMLRFWDALGSTVYATIVHHTGTKGSYMLATALGEVAAMWQDIGAEEMETWARDQSALIGAHA